MSFHSSASRLEFKGYQSVYEVSSKFILYLLLASSMDFRNPLWFRFAQSFLYSTWISYENVLVPGWFQSCPSNPSFCYFFPPFSLMTFFMYWSTVMFDDSGANNFSTMAFIIRIIFICLLFIWGWIWVRPGHILFALSAAIFP